MEKRDVVYLAGLFDGVGSLTVNVSESEDTKVGYQMKPKLLISLRESDTAVLGLLDEYCEEGGVQYFFKDRESDDVIRFIVQKMEHIERFLQPLGKHLIRKYEDAELLVNVVLPGMKDGKHHSKEGFYELMEHVDELRVGTGRTVKYDQEWFATKWGLPK